MVDRLVAATFEVRFDFFERFAFRFQQKERGGTVQLVSHNIYTRRKIFRRYIHQRMSHSTSKTPTPSSKG